MKYVARICAWLIKSGRLTVEDRGVLISAILGALSAIPLRDIIQARPDGTLVVNGREIDREQAVILRDNAKRDLSSKSLAIVRDQVLHEAAMFTVKGCTNFDQIYASKMAVWWGMQEQKHLETLAGYNPTEEE